MSLSAPVKTGNPIIFGTPQVDQTLTASHGTYTGTVTGYSGQWYSGASAIALATSLSYTIVSGDLGNNITYQESASNAAGSSATGTSNSLGPVIAAGAVAYTYDNSIGVGNVDSAGFADLPLRAGAKRVYAGAGGSDSNNGLSHATRKLTAAAAWALVTDGAGDQLLLAEGSTFTETVPSPAFYDGGYSLQYPLVIQSYDPTDPTNEAKIGRANGSGSHARPKFTGTTQITWIFGNFLQRYIALRGIDWDQGDNPARGIYAVTVGDGLLIENCIVRNGDIEVNSTNAHHWIFRLNSVYGSWNTDTSNTGSRQGLFISGCDSATIEDNVIYHFGWRISTGTRGDGTAAGNASIYSHAAYIQDTGGTLAVMRRNLIVDGAADGGSLRSDTLFQDNVSLRNPIAVGMGGVDYDLRHPYGQAFDVSYNIIFGTADINSAAARGWGISSFNGNAFSLAQYNILANGPGTGGGGTPFAFEVAINSSDYLQDSTMTFDHNIVNGWMAGATNIANTTLALTFGSPNSATLIATNNAWDKATSGSNVNVGTLTFPTAYNENTLATAAGYASVDAMMAHAKDFPEEMPARSLAALARAGYGVTKPLRDLAWRATWGTGVAEAGIIVGTVDGSTLSVVGSLPSGVTLNNDNRTFNFDGTPTSASSGNITLRETASDGSTHDTTLPYSIVVLPALTVGTITHGTTTATIPITTTGSDGTLAYVLAPAPLGTNALYPRGIFENKQVTSRSAFPKAGNVAVSSAGTKTFSPTGLTSATTYYLYAAHKMASGLFSQAYSLGSFTTS